MVRIGIDQAGWRVYFKSRVRTHKIPFFVKINPNEFLSLPNRYNQTLFRTVKAAWKMGAVGIGATINWGSAKSDRQRKEIAKAF